MKSVRRKTQASAPVGQGRRTLFEGACPNCLKIFLQILSRAHGNFEGRNKSSKHYTADESRTRREEQRRKYSKMDKRAKDKLVRSLRENGGG